jgi:hypothetical protein
MSTEGDLGRQVGRISKQDREQIFDVVEDAEAIIEESKRELLSSYPWYAVTGWGAVSPAGWSAAELCDVVNADAELPFKRERRCEGAPERHCRAVPALASVPEWMKQPRFRRTTTIARYAIHAAMEALGEARLARLRDGKERVGVIFCTTNGCVQFCRRFYSEVLNNPSLASPILFPETVFNAPSSHLATLLGSREINYTLVGDSAQFLAGLDLGTQWLADGVVDAVLVVAADELDWLTDEALMLFHKGGVLAEGAAAVLLERRTQQNDSAPLLQHVCGASTYGANVSRMDAARSVLHGIEVFGYDSSLLCDSLGSSRRTDKAERMAWKLWRGPRISVRRKLGEGFSTTSGWQVIAGLEWIRQGLAKQALVSAVGLNQQALGAVIGLDPRLGVAAKARQEPRSLTERATADESATVA